MNDVPARCSEPHRRPARCRPPTAPSSSAAIRPTRAGVVSVAPESTADDVRAAVDAATEAAAAWRRTTPSRRAELLTGAARLLAERGDAIAAEMVAEEGKPLADARNEASRTPRTSSCTRARPTG